MRFSTCETLRSVVLNLKLAWFLLGGLIFGDFRDCMSALLCCEILFDEFWEIIRMIFHGPQSFYLLLLEWLMMKKLRSLRFACSCFVGWTRTSEFCLRHAWVRTCSNMVFLWERFLNLVKWLLAYDWEYLGHQDCICDVIMLSGIEYFSSWVEEECFAPPLSRLMIEWECPKFVSFSSHLYAIAWSEPWLFINCSKSWATHITDKEVVNDF